MIKFLCPNGHPLSAPENLAGKGGRCPKCSTPFVVPAPEEGDAPGAGEASATPNPVALGSGKGKANAGELFVFLCPNGHRLNGPPSLKGKAGQCPHCGARFRVPSDEDLEEEAAETSEEEEAAADGFTVPGFGHPGEQDEVLEEVQEVLEPDIDPPPEGVHALGYIVARLWDSKTDQTELEVFLNEGEIMLPEYYSEILSCSDYGVFATREGDGTYTVMVVPWSHVRKVGMRKIDDLSPRMFR